MQKLFVALAIISLSPLFYRLAKKSSELRHIQNYRFHPALISKIRHKHPALSDQQLDRVLLGLRDYFYICHRANHRMVAMPSQIVDDAWHEFILFTHSYQQFCQKAFGRFLHHTPAEAMTSPSTAPNALKRAWRLACLKEKIHPRKPCRLPLLFALDAELGIAGGFKYSLNCLPGSGNYCASHIGCNSGCGGGCGGNSDISGGNDSDSSGNHNGCRSDGGCSSGGCAGGGGGD